MLSFGMDIGIVGYFQSDNAATNNTCLYYIFRTLLSGCSDIEAECLRDQRRIRCFGRIINLVAKAFLGGDNKDILKSLDKEAAERFSLEEEDRFLNAWRKLGPVGKLHNVHFVRRYRSWPAKQRRA